MSTLNSALILGSLASIGLVIGGIIGLTQSSTPDLFAWIQLTLGGTALISLSAVVGGSALQKKHLNIKRPDDS